MGFFKKGEDSCFPFRQFSISVSLKVFFDIFEVLTVMNFLGAGILKLNLLGLTLLEHLILEIAKDE
jgi:hypothetical protein